MSRQKILTLLPMCSLSLLLFQQNVNELLARLSKLTKSQDGSPDSFGALSGNVSNSLIRSLVDSLINTPKLNSYSSIRCSKLVRLPLTFLFFTSF
jgi:hypothetical protein